MKFAIAITIAAALGQTTGDTHAQSWPAKPIRLVVPFAAGGALDVVARIVGQKISESWSRQVIIENRLGAGGNIGAEFVAKSAPDGYTLLMSSVTTQAINMSLLAKPPYDFERDYAPASMVASAPLTLMIHPALPAKSVREFIAIARARPRELNYFSSGVGTGTHLAAEIFDQMAGIRTTHVPYKGAGQAISDLLAGQMQFAFTTIQIALPHLETGKLRVLGIGSTQRFPRMPNLPTIAESGVSGYEAEQWYGVIAPRGTPTAIVSKLSGELRQIVANTEIRERLLSLGIVPTSSSPEAFAAIIKENIARFTKVIKTLDLKVE